MKVTQRGYDHGPRELNDVMEFDHVVRVHDDGTVSDSDTHDIWAPDLSDDELDEYSHIESQPKGWRLMNGYSGQYGYSGPLMHQSEFIGGRMARDIMATPGLYVALVNDPADDSEPTEWAVAYIHDEQ